MILKKWRRISAVLLPFFAAMLLSGCFLFDDEENSDVFAAAKSDVSAGSAAASELDFMFLTAQKTELDSRYIGKRAYLLAYNIGDDDIGRDYTGGAFLYGSKADNRRISVVALPSAPYGSTENVFSSENCRSCPESTYLRRNIEIMRELKTLSMEKNTARASTASAKNVPSRTNTIGEKSSFYITYNDDSSDFQQRNFTLENVGTYCKIWYYDDIQSSFRGGHSVSDVSESDLTEHFTQLANKFDAIFEPEQIIFGSTEITNTGGTYISTPEKIDILVFDINKDAYDGMESGTMGYFYSVDVYTEEALSLSPYKYKSNQSECFYIDTLFLKEQPEKIYTTLVHEFQHMLGYINTTVNYGSDVYETWYTEMLSQVAEEIFLPRLNIDFSDSILFSRVDFFQSGHIFGFFDWVEAAGEAYGNSYVFGSYLMHKYGIDFIQNIANSRKVNEASVTAALRRSGSPLDYIGAFYTWGKGVLDGTMSRVFSETLCGEKFEFSAITVPELEMLSNTEEHFYRHELMPAGFYVVDMGTVEPGDCIYADSANMDSNVRMFVYFK